MSEYPYLVGNLAALPVVASAFALAHTERRTMLISGIAAVPLALTGFLPPVDAGWYWNPERLGGLPVGVEDFLFLFSSGAMIWFLASYRLPLAGGANFLTGLFRYLVLLVLGVAGIVCCQVLGIDFTITCFIVPALVVACLLFVNRSLWPLAFRGSLGFLILYAVWLRIWLWLFPTFLSPVNASGILATTFIGVPVGEIVWAIAFGAAHPICIGYVLDANRAKPSSGATST